MFLDGSLFLFRVGLRTKRGLFASFILESRGCGELLTLEYVLECERTNFFVLGVFSRLFRAGESSIFIKNLSYSNDI